MLITQLHSPAAAEFLARMVSGVKCSMSRYGRTSLKFTSGTSPPSTASLNASSWSRSALMSPSRHFLLASQLRSLTLPLFSTLTSLRTPASSTMTAPNTSSTPGGVLAMVLASASSFLSRHASAAMAFSTAGMASARSRSASSRMAVARAAMPAHSSAMTLALPVSPSTTVLLADTSAAMASATPRLSSAATSDPLSCSSICATAALVSRSLASPDARRLRAASLASCLRRSSALYSFSDSRNDLGVVYTWRRSAAAKRCAARLTLSNANGIKRTIASRTPSGAASPMPDRSTSRMNCTATLCSASRGHAWNQSIVVADESAGKRLARARKSSPTGEKHSTTCRLRRTVARKCAQHASRDGLATPVAALTLGAMAATMASSSSGGNNPGTLPDASTSLSTTRKRSLVIWLSVKRNTTPSSLSPASRYMACTSARKSESP